MAIRQKARLQQIVDAAALGAAKELSLANTKTEQVAAAAEAQVKAYFQAMRDDKAADHPTARTTITKSPLKVEVVAQQKVTSPFGGAFGFGADDIEARAVAQVIGRPNICVLALNDSDNGTLSLEHNAKVTGDDCAVYSNSNHNIGIKSKNSAMLKATTICSAGGVQGGGKNFEPAPYFDCPQFDDPLAGRPEPTIGSCDPNQAKAITSSTTLTPGTYCGLTISNGAAVTLAKGVYVIKGAPLVVAGGASITGSGVGFFLTGANAAFDFQSGSTVKLEAPETGAARRPADLHSEIKRQHE